MPGKEEGIIPKGWVRRLTFRLLFGLILSTVVILLSSYFVLSGVFPMSAMQVAPVVAAGLGAMYLGVSVFRLFRSRAVIVGLATGTVYFLALLILGAFLYFRWTPGMSTVSIMFACLIGSLVGALLGNGGKKKRRD